mgnify:CR=1 FL=1
MSDFQEYLAEQMKDEEFKREYLRLKPRYDIIKQLIEIRTEEKLTQQELADRTGIKRANISRLESGNCNPSLELLQKIAEGLGKELHIEFK